MPNWIFLIYDPFFLWKGAIFLGKQKQTKVYQDCCVWWIGNVGLFRTFENRPKYSIFCVKKIFKWQSIQTDEHLNIEYEHNQLSSHHRKLDKGFIKHNSLESSSWISFKILSNQHLWNGQLVDQPIWVLFQGEIRRINSVWIWITTIKAWNNNVNRLYSWFKKWIYECQCFSSYSERNWE